MPPMVFFPTLDPKRGYGHLARCIRWASSDPNSWVFLDDRWGDECLTISKENNSHFKRFISSKDQIPRDSLGIWDNFSTEIKEFTPWRDQLAQWIIVDEGGPLRVKADFLLDTLPNLKRIKANRYLPGLNFSFEPKKIAPKTVKKVFVSFGGIDPFGQSQRFLQSEVYKNDGLDELDWTLVIGPGNSFSPPERTGVTIIHSPDNFDHLLETHDFVLCSYGLTAFEAMRLGKPVYLFNHWSYHKKLTNLLGLPSGDLGSFSRFIKSWNPEYFQGAGRIIGASPILWSDLIGEGVWNPAICPVCHSNRSRIVERFPHRTYHHCQECSMEFQSTYGIQNVSYDDDYFFHEYSKQYGRTYLDDFEHIQSLNVPRIQTLTVLLNRESKVLELGCAYGPFLKLANEAGFKVTGVDINKQAVNHIREKLNLEAYQDDILQIEQVPWKKGRKYQAVVLWYVIEHFPDLEPLLDLLDDVLEPGGIFAFSTPNGQGISRKKQKHRFLERSPADHFTLWNPSNTKKALERRGYALKKMRATGIHRNRFSFPWNLKFFAPLTNFFAKKFLWGDTFEAYLQKENP